MLLAEGYDKTSAEMSKEEKNAISMRKIALTKLAEYLKNKQQP
ncbi:non-canonical purine NTP pyrophosphatase [Candidatus Parcubacteria bacterium]|nr:MAG: non-canonical purine NTP pyrophosphatase [Candidatus Parcubacteria bacterium]